MRQGAIDVAHLDRMARFVRLRLDGRDDAERFAIGEDVRFQARRFHIQSKTCRWKRRSFARRREPEAQDAARRQHAGTGRSTRRGRETAPDGDGPGKDRSVLRGDVQTGRSVSGAEPTQWMPFSRGVAPALQKRSRTPWREIPELDGHAVSCPRCALVDGREPRVVAPGDRRAPGADSRGRVVVQAAPTRSVGGRGRDAEAPFHKIEGIVEIDRTRQGVVVVPPTPRLGGPGSGQQDDNWQRGREPGEPAFHAMLCELLALVVSSQLRLSEIMADPSRVEDSRGEYIEVENVGTGAFVGGFRLVVAGKDTVRVAQDTIPAGGYWVLGRVLEADNGGFAMDLAQPAGWSLANSAGRVALLDASGAVLDSVVWDRSVSGASLERCPGGAWKNSTGTYGAGDKGTPGVPNSCDDTPRPTEGSVDSLVRSGDTLRAVVRNRGLDAWRSRPLEWREGASRVRVDSLTLASGASGSSTLVLPKDRPVRSRWTVRLPPDARVGDDARGIWVRDDAGVVVLAEIQAADGGPEWIEIAQKAAESFDVSGWTVGDQSPRAILPIGAVVPAAGRLLLSSDCAALRAMVSVSTLPCVEPSPWPRLSVEDDRLSLRDSDGATWDSISWNRASWGAWPKGKTRERQELTPWGGAEGWLPSALDGGTPGYGPAEAPGWSDGASGTHAFRIAARRVRPGDPSTMLRMEVAGPREEELRIDLYDMGRRALLRIHEGVAPRGGVLSWDGRDGRGRAVRPGVYAVVVEFGTKKDPRWKAREWIVVSPAR